MEKEKFELLLIEYIDGTLQDAERKEMEKEIAINPAAALLYNQSKEVLQVIDKSSSLDPSPVLRTRFVKELQSLIDKQNDGSGARLGSFSRTFIYRMAAGLALVLVSGALFYWINKSVEQDRELARLKTEMEKTKTMMLTMLDNQSSAGKRIQGVNVSFKMEKADDEIVDVLVKTLDEDENTNVRLAALDALGRFHHQPHVRIALIKSLTTQTDPVVQIALIRLLVEIKAKQSLQELERISTDENALPAVQDEAHAGIMKLS